MRSDDSNLRFLSDFAKIATGAMGSFSEIRKQVKSMVKEGMDAFLSDLDIVSREEFERVEAMAQKARERQEQLEKRLASLEKQLKTKNKRTKR